MDYRIEKILTEFDSNLSQTNIVEELAKSVNLSVSHFQHLFKK